MIQDVIFTSNYKTLMKDKTTAGLLAIFLGYLGVHRFYLNQSGLGVLYIFLTLITCGVFALMGLIDGLIILSMDDHQFDLKYNPRKIEEQLLQKMKNEKALAAPASQSGVKPESDPRHAYEPDPAQVRRQAIKRKIAKNPYKTSGIRKFRQYDFIGAKNDFEKALEISEKDIAVHFNLACCHSMGEDIEQALYHLSRSVGLGFKDFDKIHRHDSLAYLRAHDEFDDFVKNNYRWKGEEEENKELVKEEHTIIPDSYTEFVIDEEEEDFDLLEQLNQQKEKEKILLTDRPPEQEINKDISPRPSGKDGLSSLSEDVLRKLKQLGELRDKGILNEEEFQEQKKRLLG